MPNCRVNVWTKIVMFKKQCRASSAHFGVIYNLYSAFCLTHTYTQRRHGAFKFTSHIYKSLLQNNKGCVKLSLLFCSLTAAFQMLNSLQYPINFYIDRSLKLSKLLSVNTIVFSYSQILCTCIWVQYLNGHKINQIKIKKIDLPQRA